MENKDSEDEMPLLSEEIDTAEHSTTSNISNTIIDDSGDEKEFEILLKMHEQNPILINTKEYAFAILPLILFVLTIRFFSQSSLNVPQVSVYNTHGGLIGIAFTGLLLTYFPGFYSWMSSMRDINSNPSPAIVFKILGWLLLLIAFFVSLLYLK